MSNLIQSNTIVSSGSYTGNQTSGIQINYQPGRGIKVFTNTYVISSGTVVPVITYTDANGVDYPALSGTPITTNTKQVLTIYPGITTVAGSALNDALPKTFHVDYQLSPSGVPIAFTGAYSLLE